MKLLAPLILLVGLMVSIPGFAQPASSAEVQVTSRPATLTKFDLDFPGGTPGALVTAIQKSTGKPLNTVIDPQDANRQLPPLKMSGVDAAQLFVALREASSRMKYSGNAFGQSRVGFQTQGQPSDESIWFFRVEEGPQVQQCLFFLLTPYLERGLTVDDITTAIQTAWKMRGGPTPSLSFHKETNLLIAVGDPAGLETIRLALSALKEVKESEGNSKSPKGEPAHADAKKQ